MALMGVWFHERRQSIELARGLVWAASAGMKEVLPAAASIELARGFRPHQLC